eukprot:scaffold538_cov412-Prasinococcus_capsulatus_cf.AAC.16
MPVDRYPGPCRFGIDSYRLGWPRFHSKHGSRVACLLYDCSRSNCSHHPHKRRHVFQRHGHGDLVEQVEAPVFLCVGPRLSRRRHSHDEALFVGQEVLDLLRHRERVVRLHRHRQNVLVRAGDHVRDRRCIRDGQCQR